MQRCLDIERVGTAPPEQQRSFSESERIGLGTHVTKFGDGVCM